MDVTCAFSPAIRWPFSVTARQRSPATRTQPSGASSVSATAVWPIIPSWPLFGLDPWDSTTPHTPPTVQAARMADLGAEAGERPQQEQEQDLWARDQREDALAPVHLYGVGPLALEVERDAGAVEALHVPPVEGREQRRDVADHQVDQVLV